MSNNSYTIHIFYIPRISSVLGCAILKSENETKESLRALMQENPTSVLTNFFEACNTEAFLQNPTVLNLLIALSGQHRGSCFYNIITDVNLPRNLWQITFGEELHPNISAEMPMRYSVVALVS